MSSMKKDIPKIDERLANLSDDILSSAPSGIFIFDLVKQKHTYVNQKQTEITGYTLAELQTLAAQGMEHMFHSDDIGVVIDHLTQLASTTGNEVLEADYRYRTKHNGWVWLRSRTSVFSRDSEGKPREVLGFFFDISSVKQIEADLVASRANAQQYLDVAEVILVGLDLERRVVLLNPKGCLILGCELSDVLGCDWFENFIPAEETKGVKDVYAEIVTGNLAPTEYFENHVICRDGSRKLIAWHNSLTRDSEGRITGLLSSGNDITEQRDSEQKANQAFDQMVSVLEGLEVIVYVADMDTYEVLYVNSYTKNLVGDVVGQICWQNFQAGQKGPCEFCTNDRLLTADGQPAESHIWELHNEKLGRWYHIMDKAIAWSDGRIVRLEIATDVTDMKAAEAEKMLLIEKLEKTLAEVTTLRGIIPICSFCKKIRDDAGYWEMVESYITKHSAAEFSHGICPDCLKENYPDEADEIT